MATLSLLAQFPHPRVAINGIAVTRSGLTRGFALNTPENDNHPTTHAGRMLRQRLEERRVDEWIEALRVAEALKYQRMKQELWQSLKSLVTLGLIRRQPIG